jgi:drug/metabolite transporter (DMT)-like permease
LDPTYLTLLLPIASLTCLNMVIRLSVGRSKTRWGVIAFNYLTAALISLTLVLMGGGLGASPFTLALGAATGALYTGGMFLNMTTMGRSGASIAASVSQLSVAVPVTASVLVYGESLGGLQLLGVAAAVTALPFLAYKGKGNANGSVDRGLIPLMAAMLVVQGFAQLSSKALVASGLEAERNVFFLTVFTSATLLTTPLAYRARGQVALPSDAGLGVGVGAFNMLTNMSILLALRSVPASLFFPLNGSGGLMLTTFAAALLFRERISWVNALGVALTLAAVALINL